MSRESDRALDNDRQQSLAQHVVDVDLKPRNSSLMDPYRFCCDDHMMGTSAKMGPEHRVSDSHIYLDDDRREFLQRKIANAVVVFQVSCSVLSVEVKVSSSCGTICFVRTYAV